MTTVVMTNARHNGLHLALQKRSYHVMAVMKTKLNCNEVCITNEDPYRSNMQHTV